MAYPAGVVFLLALWGLWLIRRKALGSAKWFLVIATWADIVISFSALYLALVLLLVALIVRAISFEFRGFPIWTHVSAGKGVLPNPVEVGAVLAVAAAWWLAGGRHEGWAFAATTVALAASVLAIFTELYPPLDGQVVGGVRAGHQHPGARSASPGWRENRAVGWPRAAITRVRRCPRGGPALR